MDNYFPVIKEHLNEDVREYLSHKVDDIDASTITHAIMNILSNPKDFLNLISFTQTIANESVILNIKHNCLHDWIMDSRGYTVPFHGTIGSSGIYSIIDKKKLLICKREEEEKHKTHVKYCHLNERVNDRKCILCACIGSCKGI